MTALGYLVACMLIGQAAAGVVELNCSANATCIENMMKDFARSIRQQKTVRLFNTLTVEPQRSLRQMRSSQGWLSNFLDTHALSYDWEDYTIKLASSDRPDAMNIEVYESRTAKDVSEPLSKKSKSKVEQPDEDEKVPKRQVIRRRQKRKVLQAVIPLLFGMKSSGAVIFAMSIVTVLVMKAFIASKLALMVTAGMALRRLYESYSNGVGLQNHPYLYSQYPIDFPSASSQAYSVSGVNPQFASPEMYNPTGLASQMLQSNEQSAQQSQQSPTVQLVNATRAAERWDGKSLIQRFLEPIVDGVKSIINPIANVVYDAMPTFRGLNTEVSTTKTHETETLVPEESAKQPREILVPQPRNIAQRKMNYRSIMRNKPKKYNELNVDLNKLKNNKDFHDYIKTKKYKHNYPNTYYYPRVKYFVNPHAVITRPNNSRLASYRRVTLKPSNILLSSVNKTKQDITPIDSIKISSDWKPILVLNTTTVAPKIENVTNNKIKFSNFPKKQYIKSFKQKLAKRKRIKRDLIFFDKNESVFDNSSLTPRKNEDTYFFQIGRGFFDFIGSFFNSKTVDTVASSLLKQVTTYTKSVVKENMHEEPPVYYTAAYELLMMSLDMIDGLVNVQYAIEDHLSDGKKGLKKRRKKKKKTAVTKTEPEVTTTPIVPTVKKAKKNLKQ